MHHALRVVRKNYLEGLIRKVSNHYGGDEHEFFVNHCQETFKAHEGYRIEEAVRLYEEMLDLTKYHPQISFNKK